MTIFRKPVKIVVSQYNYLSTEDEKRLFLRKEMAKHNIQLADKLQGRFR